MISDITHDVNMSNIKLNIIMQLFLDKLAKLTDTVQKLQTQIVLIQLSTQTFMNTHNELKDNLKSH